MAAARGERVKEVWRDGRRVVRDNMKPEEMREMLRMIDAEIRDLELAAGTTTTPRRTAIGLAYN